MSLLTFMVPLKAGTFLSASGRPSPDGFTFTFRTATMLDQINIQRVVRDLASQLKTGGTSDPLAFADMHTGLDVLVGEMRQELFAYTLDGKAPESDEDNAAVEQTIDNLSSLLAADPHNPQLRRVAALSREIDHIETTLESLQIAAEWQVLGDTMPATHRIIDQCPGWEAYSTEILRSYRRARHERRQGLTTPSAT